MVEFMAQLPTQLAAPDAIIVVSAHWEESRATLLSGVTPSLFYDYDGFPREAYSITYAAPGHPVLAVRIASLLAEKGNLPHLDNWRGFDYGLFIPLKLMYPQASIPAIQLSLLRGLDPEAHIALGSALRGLMGENVLVIGSASHSTTWTPSSEGLLGRPTRRTTGSRIGYSRHAQGPCPSRSENSAFSSGNKYQTPSAATPERSTCCRSTFALALRASQPPWSLTTTSWESAAWPFCGDERVHQEGGIALQSTGVLHA
jgi:hypothetical protein